MSISLIKAALEKRLLLLPPLALAMDDWWAPENKTFTPKTGTPYQRIRHLINTPVDHAITLDVTEDRGIFQVSLLYPANLGRAPADERADLVAAQFKPPLILINGAAKIEINKTPHIAGGFPDGDRWHVPVSISWQIFS